MTLRAVIRRELALECIQFRTHQKPAAIEYATGNYEALQGADALVVVTDWNEYRHPDFQRIKSTLKRPIVVDGRNLYDPERMRALGFTYFSIGRGREA